MITYRKAEQRDKERFIAIEREFYKLYDDLEINQHLHPVGYQHIPEQVFVDDFNRSLSSDEFFFMVADNEGKVVGYIFAEIVDSVSHNSAYGIKSVGYIDSVYVMEEYRGHGIGTELIERAQQWFKSKNITISTLGLREENKRAIALYEKIGFNRDTEIKMWKHI